MDLNEVYVTTNLNDENLWLEEIDLINASWINNPPVNGQKYLVRIRHQASLVEATYFVDEKREFMKLSEKQRAVTGGQSLVVYENEYCLGGGIVL